MEQQLTLLVDWYYAVTRVATCKGPRNVSNKLKLSAGCSFQHTSSFLRMQVVFNLNKKSLLWKPSILCMILCLKERSYKSSLFSNVISFLVCFGLKYDDIVVRQLLHSQLICMCFYEFGANCLKPEKWLIVLGSISNLCHMVSKID